MTAASRTAGCDISVSSTSIEDTFSNGQRIQHVAPPDAGMWAAAPVRSGAALRQGATDQSASRSCWPYLASLVSPMPLTLLTSARDDGDVVATSRRGSSWSITEAGTPWSLGGG